MRRYPRHRRKAPEKPITTENTLRIDIRFLAIVLLGVSAAHATFAKGTVFRVHHINRSGQSAAQGASRPASGHPDAQSTPQTGNHPPADLGAGRKPQGSQIGDVKGPTKGSSPNDAKLNEQGAKSKSFIGNIPGPKDGGVQVPSSGEAAGKDPNAAESRARDVNAIDTRITAPSRRAINNPDKLRALKTLTFIAPRGAPVRRSAASGAIGHSTRNAIGMPVVRHLDGENDHAVSIPAAAAAGVDRSVAHSLVKFDGGAERVGTERPNPVSPGIGRQNTNAPANPIAANRGMIDGTKLVRPGYGPSTIGGPAKAVASINGTTIRPKR
jgi:hypothetical protein